MLKLNLFLPILVSLLLTSCGKDASSLRFGVPVLNQEEQKKIEEVLSVEEEIELQRQKFLLDKARVWDEINQDAKISYKKIKKIIETKCFSCHDAKTKLPFYGRIFKQINPVNKHQVEGLKALDFSPGYPFTAIGNPPTISLLTSIRSSIIERTMPLKSYTLFYPNKKITIDDSRKILEWIDPVIEKLKDYEDRFATFNPTVASRGLKVLELKCFRCHANGNVKGGFGNMENVENLFKGKYVDLNNPEDSKVYSSIASGEMPPSKLEKLTLEEMYMVRDWLDEESKKIVNKKTK